ncbi:hypothetical protein ACGFK1_06695 [Mycobacterium sp. NPDC048908]|uniref:hypothetical protein n=1 Tax=Mycobacterium sp. NPDC048908 TaxID=3364292 RepID=UPI00371E307E
MGGPSISVELDVHLIGIYDLPPASPGRTVAGRSSTAPRLARGRADTRHVAAGTYCARAELGLPLRMGAGASFLPAVRLTPDRPITSDTVRLSVSRRRRWVAGRPCGARYTQRRSGTIPGDPTRWRSEKLGRDAAAHG